eukprot:scaffold47039_cov54-Phaeocystis_antarctica.AAC.3
MREEVRAGRRDGGRVAVETRVACTGRAHPEHVLHGCDLGRVEAQRLVEHRRALPSRKEGARCRERCGPGGGSA